MKPARQTRLQKVMRTCCCCVLIASCGSTTSVSTESPDAEEEMVESTSIGPVAADSQVTPATEPESMAVPEFDIAPSLAKGEACEPAPSPNAGVDETIDPNRYGEALVKYLTGIDELAITEETEGDEILYDDPNFGGVYGDFAGGWVVAVLDCSRIDVDRIAQLAGGPDSVRIIEVKYQFEEVNCFRDQLFAQLLKAGVAGGVPIDSTLTGRHIRVVVEDATQLGDDFGAGVPADAFVVEEQPTTDGDN